MVELFGKQIVRSHWPWDTAKYGRDYSYEFFLLVRPRPTDRAEVATIAPVGMRG
jgi:hypothetical protein